MKFLHQNDILFISFVFLLFRYLSLWYRRPIAVVFCLSYLFIVSNFVAADELKQPVMPEKNDATLRIVISGAFVSQAGIGVYNDIASYLQNKLNEKTEFIPGFSYSTINNMLIKGIANIGFVCGLPYVLMKEKASDSIELVAAPVMKDKRYGGKPHYFSYIIVPKESKFQHFSDLKGSRFVFNEEISNSGYNMPRAFMIKHGITNGFFGKILRSGSHEESIRMIAMGKADASAVDSVVYDYDKAKHPEYVSQTRIIETLGPASIPPVVVSTKTPEAIRNKIKEILLGMNKDPAGKAILDKALLEKFTAVDDSHYDDIRGMLNLARKTGFLKIR